MQVYFMFFGSQRSQKKAGGVEIMQRYLSVNSWQHVYNTDEERSSCSTDGESILEQTPPGRAGAALGSEACEGETGEKLFLFSLQDL